MIEMEFDTAAVGENVVVVYNAVSIFEWCLATECNNSVSEIRGAIRM